MNEEDAHFLVDGVKVKAEETAIPASSRGLMYGDGCFETFCAYEGRFFNLQSHLERLEEGLDYLGIDYPEAFRIDKIKPAIISLLDDNSITEQRAVVRLQVWRDGGRGYGTNSRASHYSVMCSQAGPTPEACRLATVDIKRVPSTALPSGYKFTNGINYITAARQAEKQGADDALMETINGFVSETTIANIFWASGDTVYTPSCDCDILPGITRQVVIDLLKGHSEVTVREGEFTSDDVKSADSVWICNSVKELVPVAVIDEKELPVNRPLFKSLKKDYQTYLERELMNSN